MNTGLAHIFPAKILLFGEYGIVAGGSGLAVPYKRYGGSLKFDATQHEKSKSHKSNLALQQLYAFLDAREKEFPFMDLPRLNMDLEAGLWFDSNIPSAYGLGSSGALVAAVYNAYKTDDNNDLSLVKARLAAIESFYHGSSSGIDPAVAFFQQTLVFRSDAGAGLLPDWSIELSGLNVYILDTGGQSKTSDLVVWFKKQLNDESFRRISQTEFFDSNNRLVDAAVNGEKFIFDDILAISRYQLNHLTPMLPRSFMKHFEAGLEDGNFALKLCGSGGGGYMLCFSLNRECEDYFQKQGLDFEYLYL
jgi:mevalonate kinase